MEEGVNKNYMNRVNLALKFIDENLDVKLSLEAIAKAAHYSPFHFHRIFKAIIGESLNDYITRRRVEKAAMLLITRKGISISELSLKCGFNSNSAFTRGFKKFYSVSPTEFRRLSPGKFSKISKEESKIGQDDLIFEKYICNINNHLNWIKMNANVKIEEIKELTFASITHIGVNGMENTFERLMSWARPKGLMKSPNAKMGRVFHDSFKTTAPEKVRMSVCLLTESSFEVKGEINKMTIEKGRHIVGRFEISPNDFEKSWSSLFVWMNDNGYEKAEGNPFEIYHNDFREHPENKFIVDLCIPIS